MNKLTPHVLAIALGVIFVTGCSRAGSVQPPIWAPQDGESPTLVDAVLPYVESIEVPDHAEPNGVILRLHLSCSQAPDRMAGDVQDIWTHYVILGIRDDGVPMTYTVPYLRRDVNPSGEVNNVLEMPLPVSPAGYTGRYVFRVYSAENPANGGMVSDYSAPPWGGWEPMRPGVKFTDYEFDIPLADGAGGG